MNPPEQKKKNEPSTIFVAYFSCELVIDYLSACDLFAM